MTFTLSAPVVATEGTLYSFDITPTAALADATTIRWVIVPKGALPVTSSDFPSLTGMLSFTSGATTAQTVTFIPTDDARREISKDFELRIYDAADMASEPTALDTQVVTLRDNDDATGTYGNELLTGNGDANIIGFGTAHGVIANGSAGSDFYVISRFQYGNVEITDTVGTNLVKFDAGVTITDYDEESADGFVKVISRVDLTLSTGAVITIINPVGKFVFQLGSDPIITTYDEFKGEIRAEGSNETSTLRNNEAFQVLTATTDPDISGNSLSAQFSPSFGSANVDVFSSASTFGFSQNGSAGDDFYVISRFQYGNVEITDTVGTNLIKFDVGVTITDYDEESADGFVKVISRVDLTLSTGAVITIINPVGKFVFQLGDDDVIATYDEFKGEIRAEGSNETSTLRNNEAFSIPIPSGDADAVFDDGPTDFTLVEQQDGRTEAIIIGTVAATDANRDPITYSLTADTSAGEDATGFEIDTNGQITYTGSGLTHANTQTVSFTVVAESTGADGTDTEVTQSVTINVVANTPPSITQSQTTTINGFTGHANLYANGRDATDGLFHYTGTIAHTFGNREVTVTGVQVYLPDGTIVDVPDYDATTPFQAITYGFGGYLWLSDPTGNGDWQLNPGGGSLPPPMEDGIYVLGYYDADEEVFYYPYSSDAGGGYPSSGRSGGFVMDTTVVSMPVALALRVADGEDAVTTLAATDMTAGARPLTWSLSGADHNLFDIDSDGAITWDETPDYDALNSRAGTKVFTFTATVTDSSGATDSIALTVTLLDNTPPVVGTVIDGFTGRVDAFANGEDDSDGLFHYTGDVELVSIGTLGNLIEFRVGGDSNIIYLPDGTIIEYEPGNFGLTITPGGSGYLWAALGDHDDDTTTPDVWGLTTGVTLPTSGTFYVLGQITQDINNNLVQSGRAVTDEQLIIARDTLAVDSAENQFVVTTLSAMDVDGDAVTWTLTGGADMNRFTIGSTTGEIRWAERPDYETLNSADSDKDFIVIATASDGRGGTDSITVTVTLTDVALETAPVIGTILATGFTGYTNVNVNGEDADNGVFHHTITLSETDAGGANRVISISAGEVYLSDGTILNIAAETASSIDTGSLDFVHVWLEDPNGDGVWTLDRGGSRPAAGTAYVLGRFDVDNSIFLYGGESVTDGIAANSPSTLEIDSLEAQDAVTTLTATDETPNGQLWSLDDATSSTADARLFDIDEDTGVVTWKTAPTFGTTLSTDSTAPNVFRVTARVTDESGLSDTVELVVTLVDNTAPVINVVIEDFTGQTDVPLNRADPNSEVFHYTGMVRTPDGGTAYTEDIVIYLNDGTVLEVPDLSVATNYEGSVFWVALVDDDSNPSTPAVWQFFESGTSSYPPSGTAYIFGWYDIDGVEAYVPFGTAATNEPLTLEGVSMLDVNADENDRAVTTLSATDATPNGLTWSLDVGGDAALFEINPTTGVIRWRENPDFESTVSSSSSDNKEFTFTARATDSVGDSSTVTVTVNLQDVNDAPVINQNGGVIEGFTGYVNVAIDGNNGDINSFHHTAEVDIVAHDDGTYTATIGAGGVAYLPDGTVATIPSGAHTTTSGSVWIERASDGTWQIGLTEQFPTDGTPYYVLGFFDITGRMFGTTARQVTDGTLVLPVVVRSDENDDAVVTLSATDADGDDVTWSLGNVVTFHSVSTDASLFTITEDGDGNGVIRWRNAPDFETADRHLFIFEAIATDESEAQSSQVINVILEDANDAPSIDRSQIAESTELEATATPYGSTIYRGGDDATEARQITALTDGNTGQSNEQGQLTPIVWSGPGITGYRPRNADGETLTFTLDDGYTQGRVEIYTRASGTSERLIDDSTVQFWLDGTAVGTALTIRSTAAVNHVSDDGDVTAKFEVAPPVGLVFDEVRITFSGEDQQIAEVDIFGIALDDAIDVPENTRDVITLEATDQDIDLAAGDSPSWRWELAGGPDVALFSINGATGEVTWKVAPEYDTLTSAAGTKIFSFTATMIATDGSLGEDGSTLTETVTVVLNLVENTAPEITGSERTLEGFTGSPSLFANGNTDTDGVFHFEGTLTGDSSGITISEGALAYLPDGQIIEVPSGRHPLTASTVWLEQAADRTWQIVDGEAFPTHGRPFYVIAFFILTNSNYAANSNIPDVTNGQLTVQSQVAARSDGDGTIVTLAATDTTPNGLTWTLTGGADMALFNIDSTTGAITWATAPVFGTTVSDYYGDTHFHVVATVTDGGEETDTVNVIITLVGPTVIENADSYTLLRADSNGALADTLDASAATSAQFIDGGNRADTIIASAHGDVIVGGYGSDDITLGDGADTIIYRFDSAALFRSASGWGAPDGADTIHNFKRGEDKLVLVDISGEIVDLADFLAQVNQRSADDYTSLYGVSIILNDANEATGAAIVFRATGDDNGPARGGTRTETHLRINFAEPLPLLDGDDDVRPEVANFAGDNTDTYGSNIFGFVTDALSDGTELYQLRDATKLAQLLGSAGTFASLDPTGFQALDLADERPLGVAPLEEVPFILGTQRHIIDDFTGRVNFSASESGGEGFFHILGEIGLSGSGRDTLTISAGAQLYLRDGTIADIAAGATMLTGGLILLEDPDNDGVWTVNSANQGQLPTAHAFYIIGSYNGLNGAYFLSGHPATNERVIFETTARGVTALSSEDQTLAATLATTASDPDALTWALEASDTSATDYLLFSVDDDGVISWRTTPNFDMTMSQAGTNVFSLTARITDANGLTDTVPVTVTLEDLTYFGSRALLRNGDGDAADTLAPTTEARLIDGGAEDDTITGSAFGDIIIGGAGIDRITLGDGADTLVYHFDSSHSGGWHATHSTDTIFNFKRGEDKLVFVDESGEILTLDAFVAMATSGLAAVEVIHTKVATIEGLIIDFPSGDTSERTELIIYFDEAIRVYPDGFTVTTEIQPFAGVPIEGTDNPFGSNLDLDESTDLPGQTDFATSPLTDLSKLPQLLGSAGTYDALDPNGFQAFEIAVAPTIDQDPSVVIDDFTGQLNTFANEQNDNDGVFHLAGTFSYTTAGVNISGLVAYLPDGTLIDNIPNGLYTVATTDNGVAHVWLEEINGVWQLQSGAAYPSAEDHTFYAIGRHNSFSGDFFANTEGETVTNHRLVLGEAFNADSAENQQVVTTLTATDATPNGLHWELIGSGADNHLFDIDIASGAVTWKVAPDYETLRSAAGSNVFSLTARVIDNDGISSSLDFTVTLTDVFENTPPRITTFVEDFTGYKNLFANAVDDSDGIFHFSGTIAHSATRTITISEGATIYLPDGTEIAIPPGPFAVPYHGTEVNFVWLQQAANGVWELVENANRPTPESVGAEYYYLGVYDQCASEFFYPTVAAFGTTASGERVTTPETLTLGPALAVDSAESQYLVTTLTALDDTADGPTDDASDDQTFTWALTGGADVALFAIDSVTGAITWREAPDYETLDSADNDKTFELTATVTDNLGASDSADLTVTLTNAIESQIDAVVIDVPEGQTNAFVNGRNNNDGVYHFSGVIEGDSDRLVISEGAAIYLPDGTRIDVPSGQYVYKNNANNANVIIWLEQADDGTWVFNDALDAFGNLDSFPTTGGIYAIGSYEGSGESKFNFVDGTPVTNHQLVFVQDSFAFTTSELELEVATLGTTEAASTLTWSLGGADAARFTIDSETGAIAWANTPDFDTTLSAARSKVFSLTVTATGVGTSSTVDVTVTLTENTAPDIDAIIIEDFTGQANVPIRGVDENGVADYSAGVFHYTGTIITDDGSAPHMVDLEGIVIYLPDGSTAEIAEGLYNITPASGKLSYFWAEDSNNDGTWELASGATLPTDGRTFYVFGISDEPFQFTPEYTLGGARVSNVDIVIEGDSFAFTSAENQLEVGRLRASDDTPNGVTWALEANSASATDYNLFSINDDGVVTWNDAPDFETRVSSTPLSNKVFNLRARATDDLGASTTLDFTVTLTDETDETAPSITEATSIITGFTGRALPSNFFSPRDFFHISGEISLADDPTNAGRLKIVVSEGAQAYLPDGRIIDVPSGEYTVTTPTRFNQSYIWIEDPDDDGTWTLGSDTERSNRASDSYILARYINSPTPTLDFSFHTREITDETITIPTTSFDFTVDEGQLLVTTLTATDDSPNILTWSLGGADADKFNIDSDTGDITWKTAPDYEDTNLVSAASTKVFSFIARATDGGGLSDTQAITVTLTDATDETAPVIDDSTTVFESAEGQLAVTTLTATDTTPNGLTWELSGADVNRFNIDSETGEITWKETPDFENTNLMSVANSRDFSLTATATDGGGETATQAITVRLTDVNESAPFITPVTVTDIIEGFTGRINAFANRINDDDGIFHYSGTFTFTNTGINISADAKAYLPDGTIVNLPSSYTVPAGGGSEPRIWIEEINGVWQLQSAEDLPTEEGRAVYYIGRHDTLNSIFARNGVGEAVTNHQLAHTYTSFTYESAENQRAVTTLEATDDSPNGLTWTLAGGDDVDLFNIDSDTGEITWKTAPDYETRRSDDGDRDFTFMVTATDDGGLADTEEVTVTLTNEIENTIDAIVIDFTGHKNIPVRGRNADDGVFHFSGELTYTASAISISEGARAYLPDGTIVDIPPGPHAVTTTPSDDPTIWLEQASDGTWQLNAGSTVPEGGYRLGAYNNGDNVVNHGGLGISVRDETLTFATNDFAFESDEGQDEAVTLASTDANPAGLSWYLSGDDVDSFTIDTDSGEVKWVSTPNYDTTRSEAGSREFSLIAIATDDDGVTDTLDFTITLMDVV